MDTSQLPSLEVEVTHCAAGARTGQLKLGSFAIPTPILWLGHSVGGTPQPWRAFHIPGVLMNAWDLLSAGRALERARCDGLHAHLGLDDSCPVLLDSGGYLYLKRSGMQADPRRVLGLYKDLHPCIGAVLDYPFDPFVASEVNQERWLRTLANTRLMVENNGCVPLMPIVHAHSVAAAKQACADLRCIVGNPTVVGIGSLVPLMKTHHNGEVLEAKYPTAGGKRYQSSRHLAVDIIKTVRVEFPDAFLHVFGVGGTTTMHLMFALGADSIDSIGWRLKAGYGAVQLPGLGDRFTGNQQRKNRTLLKDDEKAKEALLECECPVCSEHRNLERRLLALEKSFANRALHNAWVFVQEVQAFRAYANQDKVETFLDGRLARSPLRSLLHAVLGQAE